MNARTAIQRVEQEVRDEFLSRQHYVNPQVLHVASQPSVNNTSCKFAVIVFAHTQMTSDGPKMRIGARWLMHVPNIQAWPLTERRELIKLVIDEVIQYIEKGTIDRDEENIPTDTFDDAHERMRIRLQRTTDRTIQ